MEELGRRTYRRRVSLRIGHASCPPYTGDMHQDCDLRFDYVPLLKLPREAQDVNALALVRSHGMDEGHDRGKADGATVTQAGLLYMP